MPAWDLDGRKSARWRTPEASRNMWLKELSVVHGRCRSNETNTLSVKCQTERARRFFWLWWRRIIVGLCFGAPVSPNDRDVKGRIISFSSSTPFLAPYSFIPPLLLLSSLLFSLLFSFFSSFFFAPFFSTFPPPPPPTLLPFSPRLLSSPRSVFFSSHYFGFPLHSPFLTLSYFFFPFSSLDSFFMASRRFDQFPGARHGNSHTR